jgi:hypothetical protein
VIAAATGLGTPCWCQRVDEPGDAQRNSCSSSRWEKKNRDGVIAAFSVRNSCRVRKDSGQVCNWHAAAGACFGHDT